jgi:hypothetical protein
MRVSKNCFYLIVAMVSLIAPAVTETIPQRDLRLKKEAQNITQQSKNGYVYTSILMKGEPALRVDVDVSLPLNLQTERDNTEWGGELYSMGFKRYVVVQGDSYWVFATADEGFSGDFVGKSSDLPTADNALAKENESAAGALKADWPNVLEKLYDRTGLSSSALEKSRQEQNQARIRSGPPTGATIYSGMYIGEPIAGIAKGPHSCVQDFQAVLNAILIRHRREACMLVSDHGDSVDKILDFVTGPEHENYASLVAKFGDPLQGKYTMLDERVPEWNLWKRSDGTLIGAKRGHASYMDQEPVFFTQVVVFKR